ncbi:MAG: hypothetical protein LBI66_05870 [Burkholderiaceae bacterium]|jgi:hypothetical protein|nr:hypothetical protein [Burkholderiaceae bacterium]
MSLPHRAVLSVCARWVLGAWLCVALAGVFSPLARAGGWERLCTASGDTLWVPAPGGDAVPAGATGHGLDCPLCLPPLAPPPAAAWAGDGTPVASAQPLTGYAQPVVMAALALPPVRAPPQ